MIQEQQPATVAGQINAILRGGVSLEAPMIAAVSVRLQFKVEDLEFKLGQMTQLCQALDDTAEKFRDERDAALAQIDALRGSQKDRDDPTQGVGIPVGPTPSRGLGGAMVGAATLPADATE